jgi:hypothetical protein
MNPLEFQKYFLKQLNVFIFILFYIKIIWYFHIILIYYYQN